MADALMYKRAAWGLLSQLKLEIEILRVFAESQHAGRGRWKLHWAGGFVIDHVYTQRRCRDQCGQCDWPALPGLSTCAIHRFANQQNYRKRATEGSCLACRLPRAPGRSLCVEHLFRHAAAVKSRKAALRLRGLCSACGKNPATGARCEQCKEKRRARATRTSA